MHSPDADILRRDTGGTLRQRKCRRRRIAEYSRTAGITAWSYCGGWTP